MTALGLSLLILGWLVLGAAYLLLMRGAAILNRQYDAPPTDEAPR